MFYLTQLYAVATDLYLVIIAANIFYIAIRKDLVDIEAVANSLITVHRQVLSFDWIDDTTYNEWKDKFMSIEQMVESDETEDDVDVTVTLTVGDEDKENPQVKVSLQVTEDDSSLLGLIATYSKDLES